MGSRIFLPRVVLTPNDHAMSTIGARLDERVVSSVLRLGWVAEDSAGQAVARIEVAIGESAVGGTEGDSKRRGLICASDAGVLEDVVPWLKLGTRLDVLEYDRPDW
jgi:hypothetical protein